MLKYKKEALSLVNVWTHEAYGRNQGIATWTTHHNPMFVPTRDILMSVVYCKMDNNRVRTLIPWLYRRFSPVDV